jgi:hypothetical protein
MKLQKPSNCSAAEAADTSEKHVQQHTLIAPEDKEDDDACADTIQKEPLLAPPEQADTTTSTAGRIIATPSPNDIILGRGRPYQSFSGNLRMLRIVGEHKERYETTRREDRRAYATNVLQLVLQDGAARFLKRVEGEEQYWEEVSQAVALDKVHHALRKKGKTTKAGYANLDVRAGPALMALIPTNRGINANQLALLGSYSSLQDSSRRVPLAAVAFPFMMLPTRLEQEQQQQRQHHAASTLFRPFEYRAFRTPAISTTTTATSTGAYDMAHFERLARAEIVEKLLLEYRQNPWP